MAASVPQKDWQSIFGRFFFIGVKTLGCALPGLYLYYATCNDLFSFSDVHLDLPFGSLRSRRFSVFPDRAGWQRSGDRGVVSDRVPRAQSLGRLHPVMRSDGVCARLLPQVEPAAAARLPVDLHRLAVQFLTDARRRVADVF